MSRKYLAIALIAELFALLWQLSILQNQFDVIRLSVNEAVVPATKGAIDQFFHIIEDDLASPSQNSLSNFIFDIGFSAVSPTALSISNSAMAQIYAGFFPSNFIQTAQALLEYNFVPTSTAVSNMFYGLSQSYWAQYKKTKNWKYLRAGNKFQYISQIAVAVADTPPYSTSTSIAQQDSWLGNFLVSIPNVTYYSFSNTAMWKKGFLDSSNLVSQFADQQWSGYYVSGRNDQKYWYCDSCQRKLDALSLQLVLISNAANYLSGSKSPLLAKDIMVKEAAPSIEQ